MKNKLKRRILTNPEFLERCYKTHGNEYDYSLTQYKGSSALITVICKEHGVFELRADRHTSKKQGCPKCSSNKKSQKKKLTNENFIKKAILKYGDNFTYSNTVYKGDHQLVTITCKKHGDFQIIAGNFLRKNGCQKCSNENKSLKTEDFIKRANKVHKDTYCYDNTIYKNANSKVKIICKKHGTFEQLPFHHLKGHGCNLCRHENMSISYTKCSGDFIKEAKIIHRDKYSYDKTIYKGKRLNIIVTCDIHGDFIINAGNHLHGLQGCPKCHSSQGELLVEEILKENNLIFKREVKFNNCKDKSELPFDFQIFLDKKTFCY